MVRRGLRLLREATEREALREAYRRASRATRASVSHRGIAGNREDCEVMIDQSRAIDSRRLVRALKPLPRSILAEVAEKLRTLGEL